MNVVVILDKHDWVKLNRITNSQSGQCDGRKINIDASRLNQSGGDGFGFRDKSTVKDGRLSQSPVIDRCELFVMNTEWTAFCTMKRLMSCNPVSCQKALQ